MARVCRAHGRHVPAFITLLVATVLFNPGAAINLPSGQGCIEPAARALPYCNTSMTHAERIKDLLSRMTMLEKTLHLRGSGSHTDNTTFPGVPRLGLPPFDWGLEAQHGLRVNCVMDPDADNTTRCATTFPAPPGLGATFNDTLVQAIGVATATEARALNNMGAQLSGRIVLRTPVLNLIRDPRWGRNVECPSEDPLHAGRYGAAMVSGVQTRDATGFLLGGTEVKHFAVYQVEDCGGGGTGPGIPSNVPQCSRMKFDANISDAELNETYLVAFQAAVENANGGPPTGYMCSYNAVNSVPACANKVLSDTIRSWGFEGYCGTDCSAADGIFDAHGYAPDIVHAYADAINGGTDLICNPHNMTALENAVGSGLISSANVDQALSRAFSVLFSLGLYDPPENQPYTRIGLDVVGAADHMALALDAARQSTVLLRNRDNTLPLPLPTPGKKSPLSIVVVGPQGNATGQLAGNYVGSECAVKLPMWSSNMSGGGGQDSWWPCVPTLHAALATVAPHATVDYVQGCEQRCSGNTNGATSTPHSKEALLSPNVCNAADKAGIRNAVSSAMGADVVVLALGFDTAIAGEGHDRLDIGLPGAQHELAAGVLASVKGLRDAGKKAPKVILVLYASASVTLDTILTSYDTLDALIVGHMPGVTGGMAVAEAVFGIHNDFGKLPYTVYPHVYQNQTIFTDMSFRTPPGRTHRFYTGTPEFAYGYGLSYTTFAMDMNSIGGADVVVDEDANVVVVGPHADRLQLTLAVRNTGARAGSQVVFVWFVPKPSLALSQRLGRDPPRQLLVGYTRTPVIAAGSHTTVQVPVSVNDLMFTAAEQGVRRVLPAGRYDMHVDFGPATDVNTRVTRPVVVPSDLV